MTMVSPGYGEQPLRQEDSLIPPSPPIPHNNYPQQEQDRAHFEVDKRAVYRHPLFPLLALLFEKCEVATQTGECPSSESFNLDLQAFIQHQKQDSKPFFSNSPEIDNLMLMALQVLRIHLLELEKVQELCRDFCRRYIGCLKGKLHSESLLRAEYSDEGESPPATPCNGPSQIMQDPSIAASVLSPLVMAGYSSKVMHGVRENGNSSMPMGNIHPIPGSTPLGHIGSSQVPSGSSVRITGVSGGGSGSLSFDEDDDEEDAGPGRKKAKRGILPKHATTILKSWLFQHIVVSMAAVEDEDEEFGDFITASPVKSGLNEMPQNSDVSNLKIKTELQSLESTQEDHPDDSIRPKNHVMKLDRITSGEPLSLEDTIILNHYEESCIEGSAHSLVISTGDTSGLFDSSTSLSVAAAINGEVNEDKIRLDHNQCISSHMNLSISTKDSISEKNLNDCKPSTEVLGKDSNNERYGSNSVLGNFENLNHHEDSLVPSFGQDKGDKGAQIHGETLEGNISPEGHPVIGHCPISSDVGAELHIFKGDLPELKCYEESPTLECITSEYSGVHVKGPASGGTASFHENEVNSELAESNHISADDVGDFGDFSGWTSETPGPEVLVNDDSFGDFSSKFEEAMSANCDDNWASAVSWTEQSNSVEDGDDCQGFSDFTSFPANVDTLPVPFDGLGTDELGTTVMEFFSSTLSHEEPPPSSDNQGSIPEESPIWSRLWNSDNSRSLKFQWTNCYGAKDLFSALNVDSRNILPGLKMKVPAFASTLASGPLEPLKAASETPRRDDERHRDGPDPPIETAVPPAHFDWTGSGLTNPLDDVSSFSLLDLDLLGTIDPGTGSSSFEDILLSNLEKEAESMAPKPNPPQATFSKILKASKSKVPSFAKPTKSLSQEAQDCLAQLPNLSFMKSKVLMFPVKGSEMDRGA
ncbi:unnamed protein product [Darwinula stevensoni]|uniref:MEIS N-terminal domain-containing protein n=1 Tax=Darwinula stevensoni TaxID=69355 RepID=A0A7R8X2Q8_9CRUS|nr:unnamed protein product [Darwinula stevensoni]CAG0881488.1 unnamed protein product [Darwinula stevensoni]